MANKNLNNAKEAKSDEFYTQLEDIEKEMRYYKSHFKDKVILCNCDDPYESNFFKYFAMNFNYLGLKKLIATCYATSPIMYTQLSLFDDYEEVVSTEDNGKKPYKVEITEVKDENGDGAIDLADVEILIKNKKNTLTLLEGDGDFRSNECIALLKESDIVVTNPPFSLFREYITQLVTYKKNFIIIGNMNALHYKDVFPLIRDNKVWLGVSIHSGDRKFNVPNDYPLNAASCGIDETGRRYIRVKGVRWFTNLDFPQRHEDIILYKNYSETTYPKYTNYDAIDVNKYTEIPCDYDGYMGVPDNFLDYYNPDQFEIIGLGCGDLAKEIGIKKNYRGRTDLAYKQDGKDKCPYSRIIVRRKR